MQDKLSFGAGFDWIGPLAGFIQDVCNRPAVRYLVPADCGWHAYAIRDILTGAGIKLWGLALYQDTYVFSVREAQAGYAQYLLGRSGIPYVGGIDTEHQGAPAPQKDNSPAPANQKHRTEYWLDRLNDLVDSI